MGMPLDLNKREGSGHRLERPPSRRPFGLADGDDDEDEGLMEAGEGPGSSSVMMPYRNHVVTGCPFCLAHKPAPPLPL